MNESPRIMDRLHYAKYRMLTPGGFQDAGQEMLSEAQAYGQRFGRKELPPGMEDSLRRGVNLPIPGFEEGFITKGSTTIPYPRIGTNEAGESILKKGTLRVPVPAIDRSKFVLNPTPLPGSRFAGTKLADAAQSTKAVARVINMIPGLNLIGDVFDVGEAIVGVARGDRQRQGQARQLAQQMAASGMTLDQAMGAIESQGGQLESLVGNQGVDDFGKTLAYGAFTGLPSLNPIAGLAGLVTAGDLQWEKHRRNQIFKEEFKRAQGL